jgi:hypothetical protein
VPGPLRDDCEGGLRLVREQCVNSLFHGRTPSSFDTRQLGACRIRVPDDHSHKFWIITQVRMQVGSAKETWSDGGFISIPHYSSESECRAAIAKYEDYPSKVPYTIKDGVVVGDVCVEGLILDVRELAK